MTKDTRGKYTLAAATGIIAALLAAPVFAQPKPADPSATSSAPSASPSVTTPPAATPQAQQKTPVEDKAAEAKRFADDKQKLLVRIDDLLARMKERRTCVAAAADRESLRACFVPPAQTAAPAAAGNAKGASPATAPAMPPAVKK